MISLIRVVTDLIDKKGTMYNLSADARKDEASCPGIIYIIGRCWHMCTV